MNKKYYLRSSEGVNALLFSLIIELRDHNFSMSLSFVVVKGGLGDKYIDGSNTIALIVVTISNKHKSI